MSVSIVQRNSADIASAAGPFTISFPANTAPGNLILVAARVGGTSTLSVTDDKAGGSNAYNNDISLLHSGLGTAYIFSAPNAGAAKVITLTISAATTLRVAIYEISGLATASPLDKTSSLYTATGSASVNSGSTVATTQASEWLFGICAANANETVTAGTSQSYVIEDGVPVAPNSRLTTEDVSVSATGTYQADFGVTTTTDHICLIATYKIAAVANLADDDSGFQVPRPQNIEPIVSVW